MISVTKLPQSSSGDPSAYQVILPIFQGPLDLLLYLVEENQLEITQVALAQVTDQYLAYLQTLEQLELASLAEFVVVAAQLLWLKSRALLPAPSSEEERLSEGEAGQDLVEKLREYQRYKAAATELKSRQEEGLRAYPRLLPLAIDLPNNLPLEGVTLYDLADLVRRALQNIPAGSVDQVVAPVTISLPQILAELRRQVARQRRLSFNRLLTKATSRAEIIVTFLALLQLLKEGAVIVRQEVPFSEIVIFSRSASTP